MSKEYVVVCQQIYTTGAYGNIFETAYDTDNKRFKSREAAIKHGFKDFDRGDDFNIAVVDGDKLISFDWMGEEIDNTPEDTAEIAEHLGLEL